MDQLRGQDWATITQIWGELHEIGVADPDRAWGHLRERLGQVMGVDQGFTTIHGQVAPMPADPLLGYRPIFHETYGEGAARIDRAMAEWHAQGQSFLADPVLGQVVRGHGRQRTFIQRLSVDRQAFDRSYIRQIFKCAQVEDRIVSVFPIADGLEITFGFDRKLGGGRFSASDEQVIAALAAGMVPLAKACVRSRGLMPGQQSLSPRERDVLRFLLGPLSEKEIADRLDLSATYVHQVVKAVYRKLGVRSRPGLMSMWI